MSKERPSSKRSLLVYIGKHIVATHLGSGMRPRMPEYYLASQKVTDTRGRVSPPRFRSQAISSLIAVVMFVGGFFEDVAFVVGDEEGGHREGDNHAEESEE